MGGFTYRTACAVVMVGSVAAAGGQQPRPIGPAHATISRVSGPGGKKALCGAFVAVDEQVAWPPPVTDDQLCPVCATLATL
jgi:hypothetical protein